MLVREFIDDIKWDKGSRLAVLIAGLSFVIGVLFSKIDILSLLIWTLFPVVMLLIPWLWVWDVPRKYFFQAAPESYVLVFGWAGVVYNAGRILVNVYATYA